MPTLIPRQKTAPLEVQIVNGSTWKLSDQNPKTFTMVVFYRGWHCPICQTYLQDLEQRLKEFWHRGVDVIAVSGDVKDRATRSKEEWGLDKLTIGYGQEIDSMQDWGLYVSNSIKEEEPSKFGEPGVFLIQPDGELYYAAINSMPFARPRFKDLLSAVDFVKENTYPARGEG